MPRISAVEMRGIAGGIVARGNHVFRKVPRASIRQRFGDTLGGIVAEGYELDWSAFHEAYASSYSF